MKYFIFAYFFTISSTLAQTQDSSKVYLDCFAMWPAGEEKYYRITTYSQKYETDSLVNDKTKTDAIYKISVIDSTAKGYLMEWSYIENLKDTSGIEIDEDFYSSISYPQLSFKYRTDENGSFLRFEKSDTLLGNLQIISEQLRENIAKKLTLEEVEKYRDLIDKSLTPQSVFQKLFREHVRVFHYFHGYESEINDTLKTVEELMIPLAEIPLRLDIQVFCSSTDSKENTVEWGYSKEANKEDYIKIMAQIISENSRKKIQEVFKDMELYFTGTYILNYKKNWPKSIRVEKELKSIENNIKKCHHEGVFINEIFIYEEK